MNSPYRVLVLGGYGKAEAGDDKPDRNDGEPGAQPRQQRALGGKKYARIRF